MKYPIYEPSKYATGGPRVFVMGDAPTSSNAISVHWFESDNGLVYIRAYWQTRCTYVRDHLEALALAETWLDNHYRSGEPTP